MILQAIEKMKNLGRALSLSTFRTSMCLGFLMIHLIHYNFHTCNERVFVASSNNNENDLHLSEPTLSRHSVLARDIASARTVKLFKLFLCIAHRFNLLESYHGFHTYLPA